MADEVERLALGPWIDTARRGFRRWAEKPHNRRWFRKIDGTPIPNDLPIVVGEEFAPAVVLAKAAATFCDAEDAVRAYEASFGGSIAFSLPDHPGYARWGELIDEERSAKDALRRALARLRERGESGHGE